MQSTNLINLSNPKRLKEIINQLISLVNDLESENISINNSLEILNQLTTIVNSLKGAMVSLGQVNLSTENITQQALTDYVESLEKTPQQGYVVYDLDDNDI